MFSIYLCIYIFSEFKNAWIVYSRYLVFVQLCFVVTTYIKHVKDML